MWRQPLPNEILLVTKSAINSSGQRFDRTGITLLTRLWLRYKSNMATTNKRKYEDSDVNKAPRIYTFNDLNENVCMAIAKFWVPEERLAYQRINQKVGRCCDAVWIQQKKLPRRLCGDAYEKCCLRSPNLREIELTKMILRPALLFEKCPRIESFKGDLSSLIQYVTLHREQNCIKSINVTDFGEFSQDMEEDRESGMRLLAEYLIHLETMEWAPEIIDDELDSLDSSQEYVEALGRRASTIISPESDYEDLYQKFKPGMNLLKLDCEPIVDVEVFRELQERHPNLRALWFVDASIDFLSILNGLQFLESVELDFNGRAMNIADNVLEMFRTFLSTHIHLKRLTLSYNRTRGFKQMVEDICRIRPTIESLSLMVGDLHVERDNIFTALLTLRNLKEFTLIADQERGFCFTFAQVTQLLAVCPKLKKVTFQPIRCQDMRLRRYMTELIAEHVAELEVQGKQYHEEHPNRKVQLIFNIYKRDSYKIFD